MNLSDIYVKTPAGRDAITHHGWALQSSYRMILVLVDGKCSVKVLGGKIGDPGLVKLALQELLAEGFIALLNPAQEEPPTSIQASPEAGKESVSVPDILLLAEPEPEPEPLPRLGLEPQGVVGEGQFKHRSSPFSPPSRNGGASIALKAQETRKVEPAPPADAVHLRRPFPVGKWLLGSMGALLLLTILGVFLYPYENYRAFLETEWSQQFGTTVRIGRITPRFTPSPMLELQDIRLGQEGQGSIKSLRLPGLIARMLGQDAGKPEFVEIQGATLSVDVLAGWVNRTDADAPARVKLKQIVLLLGEYPLVALDGELRRTPDGRLESVRLVSADRGLKLDLSSQGGELFVVFEGSAWKPLPAHLFTFNFISAKGVLQPGRLMFNTVDMRLFGGRYEGGGQVSWGAAGFEVTGNGTLFRLDSARLTEAWVPQLKVSGDLSGPLQFRMKGNGSTSLLAHLEAETELSMSRGELHGVDLAEAVRQGKRGAVKGGVTRFEGISAVLRLQPTGLHLANIRLKAGLMQAEGNLEVDHEGVVSGVLGVGIAGRSRANVVLQGKLPNLEAGLQ